MPTCDVAIIGAGIIGAACAHEFSAAGLRVAIVEPYAIAAGATNAGQGHLLVLDDSPAQFALSKYSLQLWRDFAPQLPEECEYWKCGTVWVAADAQEMELAENRAIFYHRHGVRTHFLDQRELAALEPNLRRDLAGGLLVTEDASLRPPRAAEFLIQLASQRGASLIYQRAAKVAENLVTLADGTLLHAGSIINATGTDAAELTPGLPIRPRKGHIVVVKATTSGFAHHQVMELGYLKSAHASEDHDSVAFNVRLNKAGELLVGSSRQYQNVDPEVEPKMVAWLIRRAIEFMPAIADAKPLRSWAGFRAGTPDGLPLIGPCPGFQRVFAATGHEGLGATTSLATARLLADAILARTPEIDPAPYLPSRFSNN
jgi:glycine/D-amino acid oxidase-like deaminating enzyme